MSAAADVRRTDPRPALADVLAALTGESRGAWIAILREYVGLPRDLRWERDALVWGRPWQVQREGGRDPRVTRRGLTAATPAEAVEVLATRGLWPWPVGDDASPRWWCPGCAGNGRLIPTPNFGGAPCPQCRGDDTHPPTLAALVAVASLGVEALRRAEGLALQLVGRAPRLVWRVMTREAVGLWAERGEGRPIGEKPRTIAQASALLTMLWTHAASPSQIDSLPWRSSEAAVLRDLVALGLHLVGLEGDRVVIAVASL